MHRTIKLPITLLLAAVTTACAAGFPPGGAGGDPGTFDAGPAGPVEVGRSDALAAADGVAAGDLELPSAPDGDLPPLPSLGGPFKVGLSQASFTSSTWGKYLLTIYYPAASAGTSTPLASTGAPYPGVVFAHGSDSNKDLYTWVGKHLSSWGFVCLLFSVPKPAAATNDQWVDGIRSSVDYLVAANSKPGILKGAIDVSRIGSTGYSAGAMGTLLAAAQDPRIRAVVSLAPCWSDVEAYQPLTIPAQIQVGGLDGLCPPAVGEKHYNLLTSPKQLLVIRGANHIGFLDAGLTYEAARVMTALGLLGDKPATISRESQEQTTKKYLTSWLQYYLKGNKAYGAYLFGAQAQQDLAAGVLDKLRSQP